jgi:hypothetical protein
MFQQCILLHITRYILLLKHTLLALKTVQAVEAVGQRAPARSSPVVTAAATGAWIHPVPCMCLRASQVWCRRRTD